jgi:hypothetical protein
MKGRKKGSKHKGRKAGRERKGTVGRTKEKDGKEIWHIGWKKLKV